LTSAKKEITLSRDRGPISKNQTTIEELLQELAEHTDSHWQAKSSIVKKKDRIVGVLRACVMVKSRYPLTAGPHISPGRPTGYAESRNGKNKIEEGREGEDC